MKLEQRLESTRLILCDVDGVLTDGGIWFDNQGIELKQFYVRDGMGIRLWHRAGYKFGMITARSSHIVKVRAAEMGVDLIRQGFDDKLPVAEQIVDQLDLKLDNTCYVGDDLTDIMLMKHVGLAVAVADAAEETKAVAHHVTKTPGGRGAVRELIEFILKAQHRWDDLVRDFLGT